MLSNHLVYQKYHLRLILSVLLMEENSSFIVFILDVCDFCSTFSLFSPFGCEIMDAVSMCCHYLLFLYFLYMSKKAVHRKDCHRNFHFSCVWFVFIPSIWLWYNGHCLNGLLLFCCFNYMLLYVKETMKLKRCYWYFHAKWELPNLLTLA